ncbi:MAG: CvpA family protein [Deferrisomatales bacterium]|nr:CvpA family protein [Deferrisomatales bacterium]
MAVAVGAMALRGSLRGFFREAFGLLALTVGLGASLLGGEALGRELGSRWDLAPAVGRTVAHVGLFLGPYAVLQALGYAASGLGRAVFLGGLDRVAGAVFGAAAASLLAGAGLGLVLQTGWGAEWGAASVLAKPLQEAFQRLLFWAAGYAAG